jgi:rfaE bifunctional protein nucleotidyltransferase chain/domain
MKKVVFTNGVFDILHIGHIYLLEKSKKLGDKLIVGINSDKSASQIKRKPIISEKNRKKMLESIKWVDKVIIFNELNPLSLLKKIKPNILVKGGDYSKNKIIGKEFIESYGGKVIVIPLSRGNSTTKIIEKIKGRSFKKDLPKKKGGYL